MDGRHEAANPCRGVRETPPLQEQSSRSKPNASKASSSSRRSPDGNSKRKSKPVSKDANVHKPRGAGDPGAVGASSAGKPQAGLHYQMHTPDYAGIPRPSELLARRASACGRAAV